MSATECKSANNVQPIAELIQTYITQYRLEAECECTASDIQKAIATASLRPNKKLVINWGAGKGKTTAQLNFIWMHYPDGIVYSAQRIDEIEEMARRVASAVPAEKILVLHSRVADDILEKFHSDPHFPNQFDVVLITHEMLVKYPPDTFLGLRADSTGSEAADLLDLKPNPALQRKRARKYLFIDEHPKYFDTIRISPVNLTLLDRAMTRHLNKEEIEALLATNQPFCAEEAKPEYTAEFMQRLLTPCIGFKTTDISEQAVHSKNIDLIIAAALHDLLSGQNITPTNIRRAAYKTREIARMMASGLYEVQKDELVFYMGIPDLAFENICIFDATGDLLHRGSLHFQVVREERWANRLVVERMERTDFHMISRNIEKHRNRRQTDTLPWMKDYVRPRMKELLNRHRKILVVMWKDLQGELQEKAPFNPVFDERRIPNGGLTGALRQTNPLERQADVYITHYLSGETRGTNAFMDAEAILFLGKFSPPNSIIAEHNRVMGTSITLHDWLAAEYVQAIYRTAARRGKPISLYFSEDIDEKLIAHILTYTQCKRTDGADIARQFNAELQLKQALHPDPRNRALPILITKAPELLRGDEVAFDLTDELLGGATLGNIKASFQRLVGSDCISSRKGRRLCVQLPPSLIRAVA